MTLYRVWFDEEEYDLFDAPNETEAIARLLAEHPTASNIEVEPLFVQGVGHAS